MVTHVLCPIPLAAIADAEEQAAVGGNRDARSEMLALAGEFVHPEEFLDAGQVLCVL